MNFQAVIDLAKYTLALAAAGFVYTIEKLVPAETEVGRYVALALLLLFVGSSLAGIFILSAATAALHGDKERAERQRPRIEAAATFHIVLLFLAVVLLGGKLIERVLTENPKPPALCCVQPTAKP